MVITRRKEGWREIGDGNGETNGDGRRLDLGGEHTIQHTGDAL